VEQPDSYAGRRNTLHRHAGGDGLLFNPATLNPPPPE